MSVGSASVLDVRKGAYGALFHSIEASSEHVFLTGRAGTGKSTFVAGLVAQTKKRVAVVAPSGLAAVNVGGQTIHSLFNFPPRLVLPSDVRRARESRLIANLDMLVVDEVSMVRVDVLDAIDRSLRLHTKRQQPFGGVQMLLVGDPGQLPPVVTRDEAQALRERWDTPWFWGAPGFRSGGFRYVELTRVFRQADGEYLALLDRLRAGEPSQPDLRALLDRVRPDLDPVEADAVTLAPTNEAAGRLNTRAMARLTGEERVYQASVEGEFDPRAFPVDSDLTLKVGARVVLLKNDAERRWVNGTIARVARMDDDAIIIDLNGERHEVQRAAWERCRYTLDVATDKIKHEVIGTVKQFPLRLAWALTIHKSQGLSFDRVHVDLDRGLFAHGQAYVAMSRCRTLEGLTLSRQLRRADVMIDPEVANWVRLEDERDHGDWRDGTLELAAPGSFID